MFVHVDPDSRLAKFILIIGLPMFGVMIWFELEGFSRAYRSRKWPTANGVILESRVDREWGIHGPHSTARIRYTYGVAGRLLQNDTIAFGPARGCMTWGYADRKAEQFPKGRAIGVFYHPDNPEISCLEAGGLGWEDCFLLFVCANGLVLGTKELRNFLRWLLPAQKCALLPTGESLSNTSDNPF